MVNLIVKKHTCKKKTCLRSDGIVVTVYRTAGAWQLTSADGDNECRILEVEGKTQHAERPK
jgi:hypothetical protein